MVALIELVGIIMCARNLMGLYYNFCSHLVAHNKVHYLSLNSHIVIVMELLDQETLHFFEYVKFEALHLSGFDRVGWHHNVCKKSNRVVL
jgi:hypothetical protein